MKTVNIGLIGFGTIGTGLAKILQENKNLLTQRTGTRFLLRKICDKDISSPRGVKVGKNILTTNPEDILSDPKIDVVVELIGGIQPALNYILKSLQNKKSVVTANKALLAEQGEKIFNAASQNRVKIGFEASVAGAIPIIHSLKENFVANRISAIYGIINGTTNYILSRMEEKRVSFGQALAEAKKEGYAERNSKLDTSGIDSAHKLAILAQLAFNTGCRWQRIYREGIEKIKSLDLEYGEELGYCLKLLSIGKVKDNGLELRVHPTFLPKTHPLSSIRGAYNGIYLCGDLIGEALFQGKGAGAKPTASSVIADIVSIAREKEDSLDWIKTVKKKKLGNIGELETKYYFRFMALDKPGVLAQISAILGKNGISILSCLQKERGKTAVPVVMLTHQAKESSVQAALKEINRLSVIKGNTTLIRVEE